MKSKEEREQACHEWALTILASYDSVMDTYVWTDAKTDCCIIDLQFRSVVSFVELTEISKMVGKPYLVIVEQVGEGGVNRIQVKIIPTINF